MRVNEYVDCDATALAELIRRGEVTAAEAYEAAVEAIEAVNPHLNAIADGPWRRPLEHAPDGPFGGVPFALKDIGPHPRGVPMRSGSRLSGAGIVHEDDSFLVRRFREAGLAIGALTTTPEFGYSTNTEAVVYGSTHNPWDLTRSAGGSSGGAAALVAAGGVPIAHASDGGGSIRVPAACNGLVGLKPSRGRISCAPDFQEVLEGWAADFVVTRTLRDCAATLDATAGAAPGDKFVIKDPERPWSRDLGADPGRLRVAVHTGSWSTTPVDREVASAVEVVARELAELGHHVEPATPVFDFDAFIAAVAPMFAAQHVETIEAFVAATGGVPGPDTLEATTLLSYDRGQRMGVMDLARARAIVNEIVRSVGGFFTSWDLLVTPTMNVPPLPLGHQNANDPSLDLEGWVRQVFDPCSFSAIFNWTGTPAISLPLGWTSDGLPIGVQLAAPMCREDTLIQVGSQLEAAMPWDGRRPAVHAANVAAEQTLG